MEDRIRKAFIIWKIQQKIEPLDFKLAPFLNPTILLENGNWLATCRRAKILSTGRIASKLKMTRSTYCQFEESERLGTISLGKLGQIAEAMDCELVYCLRPKSHLYFSELLWKTVLPEALKKYRKRFRDRPIEPIVLARLASNLMEDSKFRRAQGWSRRK